MNHLVPVTTVRLTFTEPARAKAAYCANQWITLWLRANADPAYRDAVALAWDSHWQLGGFGAPM